MEESYVVGRRGDEAALVNASMWVHENEVLDMSYAQAVQLVPRGIFPAQMPTYSSLYLFLPDLKLDGTRDIHIREAFTTYIGVSVNHIGRSHADGSLASVVN